MELSNIRLFLGYSICVNFALFFLYLLVIRFANKFVFKVHVRWSGITEEMFYETHYKLMQTYQVLIVFFNIVPWIVLTWMK